MNYMDNIDSYYKDVCQLIRKKILLIEFYEKIASLSNKDISDVMKLIKEENDNYVRVILNHEIEYKGTKYSGEKAWETYKSILMSNEAFAKEKIQLSEINFILNRFIYYVDFRKIDSYDEILGDIYYYQDGEQYLKMVNYFFKKTNNF